MSTEDEEKDLQNLIALKVSAYTQKLMDRAGASPSEINGILAALADTFAQWHQNSVAFTEGRLPVSEEDMEAGKKLWGVSQDLSKRLREQAAKKESGWAGNRVNRKCSHPAKGPASGPEKETPPTR